MKKFIGKLFLFIVIIAGIQAAFWGGIGLSGIKLNSLAAEVFAAMELSEKPNDYKEVIIGDSVCRQLFSPEYQSETKERCYLGTNQAITVCGSYLLLMKYLENNPQTETVYYVVRPQSLANDMWTDYSYQYFIIPFYNSENKKYLERETVEMLEDKFGKAFIENPVLKGILLNNSFFMKKYLAGITAEEKKDENRISGLTAVYLRKIEELCRERQVNLYMIPSPLEDNIKNHNWQAFLQDIKEWGYEGLLKNYTENVCYYPKECFSDGVHFKKDFLQENRDEIIKKIMTEKF